jgi:hypothetical protein
MRLFFINTPQDLTDRLNSLKSTPSADAILFEHACTLAHKSKKQKKGRPTVDPSI